MAKGRNNEWAELDKEWEKNHRPHAGHFSWESDRSIAEEGVLTEFIDAMKLDDQLFFKESRHRGEGNDPPDCEAEHVDGGLVGIEITELVDESSIRSATKGQPYDWKDWRDDLVPTLESIIGRKDNPKKLKGGPYRDYVLLIHTDEPWLELEHTRQLLESHVFPETRLITMAYLLISYDPWEKQYPCIHLNIKDR